MQLHKIEFGGRERTLKFLASTMRDFENVKSGETLSEALPRRGHTTLAVLLWCGFKHEDTRLSVNKVFDMLDEHIEAGSDINDLWDVVGEALLDSGVIGRRKEGKAPVTNPGA